MLLLKESCNKTNRVLILGLKFDLNWGVRILLMTEVWYVWEEENFKMGSVSKMNFNYLISWWWLMGQEWIAAGRETAAKCIVESEVSAWLVPWFWDRRSCNLQVRWKMTMMVGLVLNFLAYALTIENDCIWCSFDAKA